MLFLQFTFGLNLTVEEAKDGHVVREVEGGIKKDGNRKILLFDMCRAQVLCEPFPKSAFGLPNIGETTSGATDAIDKVGIHAGESLSNLEGLFGASDGDERG
eukprot:g45746.t1